MQANAVGDRYELIEEISSGGMGAIWRGFDSVLDREVAVKLIRTDAIVSAGQAEEFALRFQREARVTARIQHHGVPQVYDAVLDDSFDRLYLVMELVHGRSLRAFIDPERPLPVSWAAAFGAQICTVLSHAHAVPVVHRDLKPDNVLVTDEGIVKVLDFGIAAILRTDVTRITATGTPIGTSQYMSPEQVQGGTIAPHSDLYALGCVLYELICGHPVFDGAADFDRMKQHVYDEPVPLRQVRADVTEELDSLVLDLLAKIPEQRPADAYEVYERLLPFLPTPGSRPDSGTAAPTGVPDPTMMFRRPNAPRRRYVAEPVLQKAAPDLVEAQQAPRTGLRESIKEARERSDALVEEARYAQAAEMLESVIVPAGEVLGPESRHVLSLRRRRAAILVVGGDYRLALPEFDALAAAFTRTEGAGSESALECLQQAALCRAELGQATVALRQFQDVQARLRATDGDASPMALEVRRLIGMLLLSEGKVQEAWDTLQPLYDDLCLVWGKDDESAQEIGAILARIRLAEGPDGQD
ncbi:Serine/threonine protein kinase [Saccharopolyspora antimicrobica]|uniref:non-specific serine/threonine protein kinase n=1 Tax=Saccharopolyspora antimicrobica TaxID=455193 RepID=A0A1I4ZQ60_9PSEU|nr:serine/threonine-protein kinase [Saccharopolyspora antimicrobica]RKT83449.1 serine/threonine protein kinase [Saccharopolyspora antimicrobica]SFN52183.1 Serine/threonine protein kinase [Saccharopolyspora antimicrobica]